MKTDLKSNCLRLLCLLLLSTGSQVTLQAQSFDCPSNACGNLNVNFNNAGEVVFCEGSTITLFNESTPGFQFFIIDWGDGAIDTLDNYNAAQHTYDIPDSLVCERPQQSFRVNFLGVAFCPAGNSCQDGSYSFGIKPEPLASFGGNNEVCLTSPFSPLDQSCHADSYFWDFGDGFTSTDPDPSHQFATPGKYTVTQTVMNTCGSDTYTRTITVVGEPEADFTQSADGGCAGSVIDFSDQSNEFSNSSWTILPAGDNNWMFTDTLMKLSSAEISVRFKLAQTYTVRQTASNVCGNVTKEVSIIMEEAPVVSVSAPAQACDLLVLTAQDLGFAVNGSFTAISWEFINGNPATGTGPDFGSVTFTQNGTIRLTVEGSCGEITRSLDVVVNQSSAINISTPPSYCSGSGPDTLVVSPAGGTWSGTGVSADGVFNPGIGPGTYTLTYSLNNPPCNNTATIEVTVEASETVTAQDRIFCIDSAPVALSVTPPGGTWSGEGISDPATGTFDPGISGTGNFSPTYTYVDGNGCQVEARPSIQVEALPQLNLPDTLQLCLIDSDIDLPGVTNISADPAGGDFTWSGPGIINANGTFNAGSANLSFGFHDLLVSYRRNECEVAVPMVIELIEAEPLVVDPVDPVCISQNTLQLVANLPGIWTGPGIIDANNGLVDLNQTQGGIHTYTINYAAETSCAQTESVQVEVIDLGAAVTAGSPESACEGPTTFTLSGASPADGRWSGPGIIDPQSGRIDLSQLMPGQVYEYNYCVESQQVAGCSACSIKSFTYNTKPLAGFAFEGTPCINENFTLLPDQPGFFYDWDFGDGSNSSAESPSHTYTTPGNKRLTQIIRTTAGCADTLSRDLYITSPPVADFSLVADNGCAPFHLQLVDNSSGDDITTLWCINGDSLAGPGLPNYVFDSLPQTTTFPILLKVTNLCGTRTDSAAVTVRPYPIVNFGFSEDEGCSPFSPDLINITLGEPDTYLWEIDNPPFSSTAAEPQLPAFTTTEDAVSTYAVRLIARNTCGIDTLVRNLTVYPPDVEAFIGLDTLAGCTPFQLSPESFSTPGSILSWEVIGPSGQVTGASGQRPLLSLPDPGIYSIVLYASRCGTDTDTAQVEVRPAPQVRFEHEPQVCLGDTIRFRNTSLMVGNTQWDFGDSTTSTAFSPVHRYDSAGVFQVNLTAASLVNNCPASFSSTVQVLGLPQSAFNPDVFSGCPPLAVVFDNQSSGVGNLTYIWDFGDGSNRSGDRFPSHTFSASGTYEVTLITLDEMSCFSDTATAIITVFPEPVSAFTLSKASYCIGQDVLTVNDQSVNAVRRFWNIGGSMLEGPDPQLMPDQAGQFNARLLVVNDFGCRDSSSQAYEVLNAPVAAFIPAPDALCAGGSVDFDNQSTFATTFQWDFGDATGSTISAPSHVFADPGNFTIGLIARSDNACPADTVFTNILVQPNPVAAFTVLQTQECGAPAEIGIVNTSSGNLSNAWDFGDGSNSMALSPAHIYDFSGQYRLQLITESDFGCRDTASQIVDIFGDPVAEATLSAARLCAGEQLILSANPTQALHYEWYFDGSLQADTCQVITYAPTVPGFYDLRLIAVYNDQCRDTLDLLSAVQVFAQPTADFDFVTDDIPNVIGDVRFVNLSTGANAYQWDLGDGTTSTEFGPEHEYDLNRDILVRLVASNGNGGQFLCTDTIVKPVSPEWIVSFEVPNAVSPDFGDPAVRVFGAVGSGVVNYDLKVYSPYGVIVWSSSELEDGHPTGRWSGDYQGRPVPQGAYTWEARILFVNGDEVRKKGSVTVLR